MQQRDFRTFFESILGSSWAPKRGPNGAQVGAQNGPESKTKKKMQKEALEDRLGEVLEPSWSDLGAILAELEAILGRFGAGWGAQNRGFSIGF